MLRWFYARYRHFGLPACQRILRDTLQTVSVQDGGIGVRRDQVDYEQRRAKVRWMGEHYSQFSLRAADLFAQANRETFGFRVDRVRPVWELATYTAEQKGFYGWHANIEWLTPSFAQNKLVMLVPLSEPDAYEGGDLIIREEPFDVLRMRQQGTALILPAFVSMCITPVTRGELHLLTGWMEGPPFT